MTPAPPQDEAKDRTLPEGPLDDGDAARHLEHLGMTPDAAKTYAAYVSGRYASFHRPT